MTPRGTSANFNRWFGRGWLGLGYVFLYVPIVALVVFSFNDSPIPNVWRGFTLKWYAALARDTEMLAGLWLSLKIAFLTACGSVVLGTLTAFALVKYKRFPGRTLFSGMSTAPLVMPEVVVGLSLLLITSTVWRQDHNGFTHQDPGFLDVVVTKSPEVTRIYLPPDAIPWR